jgi:hypothetical protein
MVDMTKSMPKITPRTVKLLQLLKLEGDIKITLLVGHHGFDRAYLKNQVDRSKHVKYGPDKTLVITRKGREALEKAGLTTSEEEELATATQAATPAATAPDPSLTPPRTHVPASMRTPYKPAAWTPARPGAQTALALPSRGF